MMVAEKLGLEVEFQVIDWGNKYAELSAGSIDCIWNGFTSNSKDADGIDRSEKVDFSYAYLDNKQCVIVKADRLGEFTSAASLSGKKAGAENGSAGESYAQDAGATIEASKSSQLAVFTDLNSGAVDFIVVDKLLADEVVGKGDYAGLAIVTTIDIEPEVYSIGCRKNSDLDEKINDALVELLNEGKLDTLAEKYGVRLTDTLVAKKTAK
jgi:polar amino acid transport system substrate-binding protein